MSTSKSFQNHQGFISYRPNSPKLNTNSPSSLHSNQNHTYVPSQARTKPNPNPSQNPNNTMSMQMDHFASIRHQNNLLRQENKALKRELHLMKGQFYTNPANQNNSSHNHEVNDLRETIKKEAGEIKELKTRLEVVSKQCKMYEDIIDKMQGKINKLTEHNRQLENKLKESKSNDRSEKDQKFQDASRVSRQKMNHMTEKINEILNSYNQLQSKVNMSDKQWEMWKEQWTKQKSYYLNRIHDLEAMMGIGVETKEFYKKRF